MEANPSRNWLARIVAALVRPHPTQQSCRALLDPVLHLATGAIHPLVERASIRSGGLQWGDDEAGIGTALAAARHPLGLGDDAPAAAPAVARRPAEVGEAAGGPAGGFGVVLGPGEVDVDALDQPRVAREPEQEVDAVLFATWVISASRAKPPSPRRMIRTRGQRPRICPTMRATSSTAPAEASMLARLSLAASRWRPQKT
jgi:hypothetical protein